MLMNVTLRKFYEILKDKEFNIDWSKIEDDNGDIDENLVEEVFTDKELSDYYHYTLRTLLEKFFMLIDEVDDLTLATDLICIKGVLEDIQGMWKLIQSKEA